MPSHCLFEFSFEICSLLHVWRNLYYTRQPLLFLVIQWRYLASRTGRKQTFRAHIPPHLPVFTPLFLHLVCMYVPVFTMCSIGISHSHIMQLLTFLEVCFVRLSNNGLIPTRTSWQLICGGLVFSTVVFSRVGKGEAFSHFTKSSVPWILELIKSPSCGEKAHICN